MTYYVLNEGDNKFESMTKEQILAAIEQAVSTGQIKDVDTGFVTTIKEVNHQQGLKFWYGTMAEFNALGSKQPNTFYIFSDDTTLQDIEDKFTTQQEFNNYVNVELGKKASQDVIDDIEAELEALKNNYSARPPITQMNFVGSTEINYTSSTVYANNEIDYLSFGRTLTNDNFRIVIIPNSLAIATCSVSYVSGDDGHIKYDYDGYDATYGLKLKAIALKDIYSTRTSGGTSKTTTFKVNLTDIYGNTFNVNFTVNYKSY